MKLIKRLMIACIGASEIGKKKSSWRICRFCAAFMNMWNSAASESFHTKVASNRRRRIASIDWIDVLLASPSIVWVSAVLLVHVRCLWSYSKIIVCAVRKCFLPFVWVVARIRSNQNLYILEIVCLCIISLTTSECAPIDKHTFVTTQNH